MIICWNEKILEKVDILFAAYLIWVMQEMIIISISLNEPSNTVNKI